MKSTFFKTEQEAIDFVESGIKAKAQQYGKNIDDWTPDYTLEGLIMAYNLIRNPSEKQAAAIYMDKLLRDGADINNVNEKGQTLFDIAVKCRSGASLLWLMSKGAAAFDNMSPEQQLQLLLSTKFNAPDDLFQERINILLQSGADIYNINIDGKAVDFIEQVKTMGVCEYSDTTDL